MPAPPELLHEILVALNPTRAYTPAVFLFATTCKLALALARPHIIDLQRRHYAPLAGHRFVCIADGPGPLAGCPAELFTPADARALGGAPDTPLYALVRKSWQRRAPDPPALARPADLVHRPSVVSRMSAGDFATFRALCEPYRPPEKKWVLYSRTRREYVRADAVESGSTDGKRMLWATVLACMCCIPEENPEMVMGSATPPKRGRWMGDCIELTTTEELEFELEGRSDSDGAAWTDVTSDVATLIYTMWKAGVRPWGDLPFCTEPSSV